MHDRFLTALPNLPWGFFQCSIDLTVSFQALLGESIYFYSFHVAPWLLSAVQQYIRTRLLSIFTFLLGYCQNCRKELQDVCKKFLRILQIFRFRTFYTYKPCCLITFNHKICIFQKSDFAVFMTCILIIIMNTIGWPYRSCTIYGILYPGGRFLQSLWCRFGRWPATFRWFRAWLRFWHGGAAHTVPAHRGG